MLDDANAKVLFDVAYINTPVFILPCLYSHPAEWRGKDRPNTRCSRVGLAR